MRASALRNRCLLDRNHTTRAEVLRRREVKKGGPLQNESVDMRYEDSCLEGIITVRVYLSEGKESITGWLALPVTQTCTDLDTRGRTQKYKYMKIIFSTNHADYCRETAGRRE